MRHDTGPAGAPTPPGGRRIPAAGAAVAVLAALALVALAAGCGAGGPSAATGPPPSSGSAEAPLRVASAPVSVRDVDSVIEAQGSIEAEEEVQVVAGVEGIVTRVRFREGDLVTPATVLAEIDPERYRLFAERARANLDKTIAQERQGEADLKRREELLRQQPPLISDEEVERARQEAERLKAAVAEARAAFDLAEQDRQRSVVHPLVSGIINRKSVVTGQHVETKAVLASLVDTRRLRLRFKVSEEESVRLRDGMPVAFTTPAWPDRTFAAAIFHVSSGADPQSRQVEILARVEDPDAALKPGFFAVVRASVGTRRGAILVPARAVLATEKGFVVYEIVSGVARQRQVTLGLRTSDGAVEILSGLGPGAIVVTDGGSLLKDGTPVDAAPAGPVS
jgi:multidrug efflux system membrane fusion protein